MKCLIENIEVNYPCSPVCHLYGDCMTVFLEAKKQRARTNADCIRSMNDEELAKWMDNFFWGHKKANLFNLLDWLRKPAEED